ncbi:hypothetical protein OKA04_12425 [Luteolibacter flavescens]|uniref:ABC transporter permease n=1 Tax=Luteolibacter flavescens TaxID=1859460 RepID=A0ABT3FPN2_9BACT|nr:hypothetical protein [Luteolibacter flavescens]MCW1885537.1 hypothetical protein [Luteolibacter flavescens]
MKPALLRDAAALCVAFVWIVPILIFGAFVLPFLAISAKWKAAN